MKLTNWKGMAPRSTFDRNLDRFFDDRYRNLLGMSADFSPAINAREHKEDYEIEIAVPGHDKNDIQVFVDDGRLIISSKNQEQHESDEEGYLHREFFYSTFTRSITLPKDVDDEHISATCKNGILHVHLPRQAMAEENEAVRNIPIR
jgi:HSP20 family protein